MANPDFFTSPQAGEAWQTTLDWQPNARQQAQFQTLYQVVLAGNQRLNLTRIIEPRDFWEKHLWDSLAGLAPLAFQGAAAAVQPVQAIDIGSGGGFPGLPVAIACPHYQIVLLDSIRKKVAFLEQAIAALELTNATAIAARAEALAREPAHRHAYDIALLRAVGSPADCATYALPLLKPSGVAVLYRGNWSQTDAATLAAAIAPVGGAILSIEGFTTPLTQSVRHCVYIGKARD